MITACGVRLANKCLNVTPDEKSLGYFLTHGRLAEMDR